MRSSSLLSFSRWKQHQRGSPWQLCHPSWSSTVVCSLRISWMLFYLKWARSPSAFSRPTKAKYKRRKTWNHNKKICYLCITVQISLRCCFLSMILNQCAYMCHVFASSSGHFWQGIPFGTNLVHTVNNLFLETFSIIINKQGVDAVY